LDNSTVRELIAAGIHFGHRMGRWNPKMKPYIFCCRNSIHIIDIKQTIKGLLRSKKFLADVVSSGKDVLFVGTKRQARQPIISQADRCGMPYVTERWLGGTLTNFRTIRSRLSRLEELEDMDTKGLLSAQSKKMESTLRREMNKIRRNLNGIRKMDQMPGALVLIDAKRELIAIHEARKLHIPTICLIDTDSDPDLVGLPIPGNDDAMRAIELVTTVLADAILEGKAAQSKQDDGEAEEAPRRSRRLSTTRAAKAPPSKPDTTTTPQAPPSDAVVETAPAEGEASATMDALQPGTPAADNPQEADKSP